VATTSQNEKTAGSGGEVRHPLEPLTAAEITRAVEIARGDGRLSERARFPVVSLSEPPKAEVLGFAPGGAFERRAELTVLDKSSGTTHVVVVSVTHGRVVSWDEVPQAQPPVLMEEWDEAEEAVKNDPGFQEAARRRGIDDLSLVMVDPVSAGNFGFEHETGKRLVRGVAYWRESADDNGYAYPIEGVIPIVDLNEKRVVELWEGPVIPLPPTHGRFAPQDVGEMRGDLKPLDIVQPEGASFTVDGNEVRWQKWRMRVSLHAREGLVLHTVTYDDGGRERPVLYRAALSEMVVPYGDTSQAHFWKGVFDAGEYGLGKMVNSLELGCDCVGEIAYMDAVLSDELGRPMTIPNAICMHEEDNGILWKHFDARSGDTQVRRDRRFVVSYICTVGNYDYGFYWHFHQDGGIELEMKATGIMQTQAVPPGEQPAYGTLVAPQLGAMNHQHFFNFRLDMDVDGTANRVVEVNADRIPMGEGNPHGNAMRPNPRVLARESEAQSDCSYEKSRYWRIESAEARNGLGTPTAYRLVPRGNSALLVDPESPLARRARFAGHHLWVTRFDPSERYAAGNFPNQSLGGEGLTEWQAADRPLDGEDVVVWYTFGQTHFPRPEDWPVMPVVTAGFALEPYGFFDRNPALDVPPPKQHCGHSGNGAGGA
jgi:primary-amine oxidase